MNELILQEIISLLKVTQCLTKDYSKEQWPFCWLSPMDWGTLFLLEFPYCCPLQMFFSPWQLKPHSSCTIRALLLEFHYIGGNCKMSKPKSCQLSRLLSSQESCHHLKLETGFGESLTIWVHGLASWGPAGIMTFLLSYGIKVWLFATWKRKPRHELVGTNRVYPGVGNVKSFWHKSLPSQVAKSGRILFFSRVLAFTGRQTDSKNKYSIPTPLSVLR